MEPQEYVGRNATGCAKWLAVIGPCVSRLFFGGAAPARSGADAYVVVLEGLGTTYTWTMTSLPLGTKTSRLHGLLGGRRAAFWLPANLDELPSRNDPYPNLAGGAMEPSSSNIDWSRYVV